MRTKFPFLHNILDTLKFENIDEVVKIAIDRINEIREIVSQGEPKKTVED